MHKYLLFSHTIEEFCSSLSARISLEDKLPRRIWCIVFWRILNWKYLRSTHRWAKKLQCARRLSYLSDIFIQSCCREMKGHSCNESGVAFSMQECVIEADTHSISPFYIHVFSAKRTGENDFLNTKQASQSRRSHHWKGDGCVQQESLQWRMIHYHCHICNLSTFPTENNFSPAPPKEPSISSLFGLVIQPIVETIFTMHLNQYATSTVIEQGDLPSRVFASRIAARWYVTGRGKSGESVFVLGTGSMFAWHTPWVCCCSTRACTS